MKSKRDLNKKNSPKNDKNKGVCFADLPIIIVHQPMPKLTALLNKMMTLSKS
jgi:hypothetical protein